MNRMKKFIVFLSIVALLLPALSFAQALPTTVPQRKPSLRRDRTQKVLYPKIIRFEDERVVTNELIDMLMLSHGGVRRRAILALGHIGYPSGITPLVEVLKNDRSPRLRALAAFSLGEIESHYAAAALLEKLDRANESDGEVRARIIEALGKIASNKLSADSLGKYGISGLASTIASLLPLIDKSPSEDEKLIGSLALTALLRIKQPSSISAIAAQLRSPDADLRWQAANALARIREGISNAVPALLPLLSDKDALVRAHAARALGVAADKRAVEPLTTLLGDADQRVVANAINALGAIGDARAVDPLIALGNNQLAGYRSFNRENQGVPAQQNLLLLIATSLGNIKDPGATRFLKSLRFADGHAGSFPEVEVALAKFGETDFFDIPEGMELPGGNWKAMSAYAQGLGQLATERVKPILMDLLSGKTYGKPNPFAIPDILNAISKVSAEGFGNILIEQLKAEDVIVRATAATLLGELGDRSEEMKKALDEAYKTARSDSMNDARIAIIEAANKLKIPMNVQALSGPTRDPDYIVRFRAAELLLQSDIEKPTTRLQIGQVETGHDRAYWQNMARLASSGKNPLAIIHTKKGNIRIELLASDAPMTVDNFIQLARKGYYDGLTFMRVVPNFVIQGGDPRGDMNGGPGYQIRDEINLRPYLTGAVGMALSGKDTGGSQFFITHSPQPHLDGGYTVFGQVIEGMDAVNRIARGDRIERVEIIERQ